MAKNEQQRQKKLAKKRTKELAKKKQAARAKHELRSLAGQIKAAQTGSIEHCYWSRELIGGHDAALIGSIVVTRKMPNQRLLMVRYLVDSACLGVKDIDAAAIFPSQFSEMLERVSQIETLDRVAPAKALKYLQGVFQFARESGLSQHADYEKVLPIWDGVDVQTCTENFTYGVEGVPTYRPGPNEKIHDQLLIVEKLRKHRGENHFDYEILADEPLELDSDGELNLMEYDDELEIDIDEDLPLPHDLGS